MQHERRGVRIRAEHYEKRNEQMKLDKTENCLDCKLCAGTTTRSDGSRQVFCEKRLTVNDSRKCRHKIPRFNAKGGVA